MFTLIALTALGVAAVYGSYSLARDAVQIRSAACK